MIKFSIIICTYNPGYRLSRTLNSLLSQLYKNFEIVIVDGLSSDITVDIIKDYEKKFNGKLKWISEKDNGIYDAMNKGIHIAEGEWMYFLGSGDILYNDDVLIKVYEKLMEIDCEILYGNVELGNTRRLYDGQFTMNKLIEKNICHQAIFYKKQVFDKLGVYNTRYPVLADWELNMRFFNGVNIRSEYLDEIIANFEMGGFSGNNFDKNFYKDFESIIKKNFSIEHWNFFNKRKKREVRFIQNYFAWKIWQLKNKIFFALFQPKNFINKYSRIKNIFN